MSRHVDNLICWSCEGSLAAMPQPLSRHDHCPACSEVLHCCRLCRQFDLNAVDGCREDQTEPPNNKSEANFCDFFEPIALKLDSQDSQAQHDASQKLASLFGDQDDASSPAATGSDAQALDDPRSALDALFKTGDNTHTKD